MNIRRRPTSMPYLISNSCKLAYYSPLTATEEPSPSRHGTNTASTEPINSVIRAQRGWRLGNLGLVWRHVDRRPSKEAQCSAQSAVPRGQWRSFSPTGQHWSVDDVITAMQPRADNTQTDHCQVRCSCVCLCNNCTQQPLINRRRRTTARARALHYQADCQHQLYMYVCLENGDRIRGETGVIGPCFHWQLTIEASWGVLKCESG